MWEFKLDFKLFKRIIMKQIYFDKTGRDNNKFIRFQSFPCQFGFNKSNILHMKSIKLFVITVFMIPMLWSCNYLKYNEQDQFQHDLFFSDFDRVKSLVTDAYSYLPDDFNRISGAMRSSASDEAKDVWDVSDINKFNDGSWSQLLTIDDQWSNMYSGIRSCNRFLKDGALLTFDDTKYNLNYAEVMKQYVLYPYEVRFLRAFYYFELAKRYGNVPLITTILTQEESNMVSPSSFDAIVSFISTECDEAIAHLPVSYDVLPGGETGRATKGAAMALKARALLYAASPLHNTTNDKSKWIAAATAAKMLIDTLGHLGNGTYIPLPDYSNAVNTITDSREMIFEKRADATRDFELANTAVGFIGGRTGTCPTQNLVDSYEMKATGLAINEAGSGYDPANPYSTEGSSARDPRLAMTILYNGSVWKSQALEIWHGGLNAPPVPNATKTGYYLKKFLNEGISLDPVNPGSANHYWIIFRYGEILLNYAEAMNEAYGPEVNGTGPLSNLTARDAVDYVRSRPGVEMPDFPTGMTQSDFRTKLQRERMVELAFEDHRFWDIRRWKIGPSTTTIRGVDLTMNQATMVITYTPKVVETRVWEDKMYLYPIMQSELFINTNLVQNPGW